MQEERTRGFQRHKGEIYRNDRITTLPKYNADTSKALQTDATETDIVKI